MTDDPRVSLPDGTPSLADTYQVSAPFAPILKDPIQTASQHMEAVFGQRVKVYEVRNGWGLCQLVSLVRDASRPTSVGWVSMDRLEPELKVPTHQSIVLSTPVFSEPDLKSHIQMSLPMGSQFCIEDQTENYVSLGQGQWVSQLHTNPLSRSETDYVEVARQYLGQPYIWGAERRARSRLLRPRPDEFGPLRC